MRDRHPSPRQERAAFCSRVARGLGCVLLAVLLAQLAPVRASAAQSESERALERRVKAAFLYRFTEFVNWPDSAYSRPDSPFIIVIVGADALADEVRQITVGRTVGGRGVDVRRANEGDPIPAAQMVFFAEADRARQAASIRAAPRNALVVTETDSGLAQGSVINFVIVEGRVRFEISLEAAEKRGLRMSSRLLAVAQAVRTAPP